VIFMSDEPRSDAAILASLSMEESRGLVTLRAAQERREGILPAESNQENRNVRVESCCFVDGHIFGKDVELMDCDIRTLSTRASENLPGTQINGGINAFGDVKIGVGCVVGSGEGGGVLAGGNIEISSAIPIVENGPSRTIVIGSVSGEHIVIGDGAIILGAVIGQQSVKIGNGVTIRDHVFTPHLDAGDGNLFGGLIVGDLMNMGRFNTVASGRVMIPTNENQVNVASPIRSPYPGCNNCPHSDQLGGSDDVEDYGRRLSCHLFKSIELDANSLQVSGGPCTDWTPFDLESEETQFRITDNQVTDVPWELKCVTNWPIDSLNLEYDRDQIALWEMTAESLGGF
jgi:hypothetical protein